MDDKLDRQRLEDFEASAITASASTSSIAGGPAASRPSEVARDALAPLAMEPASSLENPPADSTPPTEPAAEPSDSAAEVADAASATTGLVSARIPTLLPLVGPHAPAETQSLASGVVSVAEASAEPVGTAPVAPAAAAPPQSIDDLGAMSRLDPASARIIPFVPKGGVARELPPGSPVLPSQPFARQPIPYFISPADGGPAVTARAPAVPPPPSGFRRSSDWARQRAAPAAASVPVPTAPTVPTVADAGGEMHVAASPELPSEPATYRRKGIDARRLVKRIFIGLGIALLAYATLVVGLVAAYRWVDPPMSALMLGQSLGGTEIGQEWAPLERISPNLQLAVVLSEDARFCTHHGVDWGELKDAVTQSLDGYGARGGSTISMQTVKNLFLWPSKSYVRKAVEIPLAMGAEMAWPKARMLEIYLNIAEWGPGIFGAEAAARYHFGKSAAHLDAREAALLAVSLPNPFDRQAGNPGPGTQRLADTLQARMRRAPNTAICGKQAAGAGQAGIAGSRRR